MMINANSLRDLADRLHRLQESYKQGGFIANMKRGARKLVAISPFWCADGAEAPKIAGTKSGWQTAMPCWRCMVRGKDMSEEEANGQPRDMKEIYERLDVLQQEAKLQPGQRNARAIRASAKEAREWLRERSVHTNVEPVSDSGSSGAGRVP